MNQLPEKESHMRKREVLLGTIFVVLLVSVWWFWGRQPYIVLAGGFSDPGLVYVEPKWNGWQESGLVFMQKVPPEFRGGYPDATGWWYVKRKVANIPRGLVKMDDPIEKSLEKIEKYYTWKPLGVTK
jgi:hypothetical protein